MRFGLGWRAEIGTGIIAHLDEIDVLEVLAEDYVHAGRRERRAMQFLRRNVPLVVHATTLGLASTEPVNRKRLDAVARVVEWLQPEMWSEHLAFVRGGGVEIGHLAAPPRNDATLEGLARNVEVAARVVGSAPLLENVATLLDPPLSTYDEGEWLAAVLSATSTNLLLDLHNLHANAVNFRFDAMAALRAIPPERIGAVHLAGGRVIEDDRILDDHRHDVPDPVFELLAGVHADYVILERDGNYPGMDVLLAQLRRARHVVPAVQPARPPISRPRCGGESAALCFLARIYADHCARERFLARPVEEALAAGMSEENARRLAAIDRVGLSLAARSFARKRSRLNGRA